MPDADERDVTVDLSSGEHASEVISDAPEAESPREEAGRDAAVEATEGSAEEETPGADGADESATVESGADGVDATSAAEPSADGADAPTAVEPATDDAALAEPSYELDPVLAASEDVARAALVEITPADTIGELVATVAQGEHVVSLQFANRMRGYPGWLWTATLSRIDETEAVNVLEVELLPGEGAVLAPDWVPWSVRLADYRAAQDAAGEEFDEGDTDEPDDEDDADDDDFIDDESEDDSDDDDDVDDSDDDESDDDESDDDTDDDDESDDDDRDDDESDDEDSDDDADSDDDRD